MDTKYAESHLLALETRFPGLYTEELARVRELILARRAALAGVERIVLERKRVQSSWL
jgi:hypothetical protein